MVYSLADLISIIILPIGALIFLGLFLYLRGQWWWSTLSALLWILFGYNSISTTPIFAFERELGVVWIVIGIAVIWMPAYYRKGKEQKTMREMAAEADGEDLDDDDKLEREITKIRQERWREHRGIRKGEL